MAFKNGGQGGAGINLADFNQQRPALRAEHVNGDVAVLTIAGTEVFDIRGEDGPRKSLKVTFKEYPEHAYWPNYTSLKHLVSGLGANDADWVGKRIPLEKVTSENPNTREETVRLWVCEPSTWDDHFDGYDRAVRGSAKRGGAAKRGTAKKTAGRGRK